MGLFLTLLYIFTAYMGPYTVWGPLADLHIEIVLAVLATIASLPNLGRAQLGKIPQGYALAGMVFAVFLSILFNVGIGSSISAVMGFVPCVFAFYLVVLNCRTRMHLQLLVATLVTVCFYVILKGHLALAAENYTSPFLMPQGNVEHSTFYRLRGMAFINDPNDFGQVLVSLIPCLFLFWRKGSFLRNVALVMVPSVILVYGMFLTHSRGGMVALLAVILFASRKKLGTVPAVIIAVVLFAAAGAVGWSGGRDVNMSEGEGRMEAWATGIQLLKTHPLFGVGMGRFTEFFYITAHNTIMVCAAETGMFGLFWWATFVFATVRDAVVTASGEEFSLRRKKKAEDPAPYEIGYSPSVPEPVTGLRWQPAGHPSDAMVGTTFHGAETVPAAPEAYAPPGFEEEEKRLSPEEARRVAALMPACLLGYLVAGWFLSRAYIMTLFIYGGMVQVVYRWALDQQLAPPRMSVGRVLKTGALGALGLILVVYIMLRAQHLMGH